VKKVILLLETELLLNIICDTEDSKVAKGKLLNK